MKLEKKMISYRANFSGAKKVLENVKFEKAQLGDDAGIMGAFVLAQEGVK